MRRDLTAENSDLYEFKMALFDNSKPEDFLLFFRNFNIIIKVWVTLKAGAKIQCLCSLVRGEVLCQFDALSAEAESATPETLSYIILGLGT